MTSYYFDTSALLKRYAIEPGTLWVAELTDPASGHEIITSLLTGPEMIAAFYRKARTGPIPLSVAQRLRTNFRADWLTEYQIIEVSAAIIDTAMVCAERHGLRGYDAVHLAAAVELQKTRRMMRLSPLFFISADNDQIAAAAAEGLAVDNPNSHP